MAPLNANSLENYFIAAAIIIAAFVIGAFCARSLQSLMEKAGFDALPSGQRKKLKRLNWLLRLFIIIQGLMIALDRLPLLPPLTDLAGMALPLFSHIVILLTLIAASRCGFELWIARSFNSETNTAGNRSGADSQTTGKIKKARTLINLLPLPLAVILLLPDLNLELPEDLILTTAAFFILLDGLLLTVIISSVKNSPPEPGPQKNIAHSLPLGVIEEIEQKDADFEIVLSIASLFLEIQKRHLGAGADSASRVNLLNTEAEAAKYLFELEVHLYGSWKKRRLTIARLGAETGSRSKCFYVIYDEYLVVKVPPIAITDSVEYIDILKIEAAIAKQINMAECIIPVVSVILKHVEPSIEAQPNSLDSPEVLAMKALRQQPDLYRYLKIGGTFAYFMNMSKYFFLQDAIKMLHETSDSDQGHHFLKSKTQIEAIVANLLDLLAFIGNKGVALRDLKPDNLLLAGDQNDYPSFLTRPADYKIGLIDIETAVVFGNPHLKHIAQPQLGGTPQYATPGHFFTNRQIDLIYGKVADILQLQDWYGMLGVIYKVIDNQFLFEKTGRLIHGIASRLNQLVAEDDFPAYAISINRLFWNRAEIEFQEKMAARGEVLKELKIPIAEPALTMLQQRLAAEKKDLTTAFKKIISEQKLYPTEQNKITLLKASARQLEKLSLKWKNMPESHARSEGKRDEAVRTLQNLQEMREKLECQAQILKILNNSEPRVPASLLLESMFSVVNRCMFPEQWRKLPVQNPKDLANLEDNGTDDSDKTRLEYQTVINDQTIRA